MPCKIAHILFMHVSHSRMNKENLLHVFFHQISGEGRERKMKTKKTKPRGGNFKPTISLQQGSQKQAFVTAWLCSRVSWDHVCYWYL